jgi:hypothetical protein
MLSVIGYNVSTYMYYRIYDTQVKSYDIYALHLLSVSVRGEL